MRLGSQAAVRPERQSAWRCFRFLPAGHPVRLPDPARSLPSAAPLPGFLPGCRRKGSLRREYRPETELLFAGTGNGIYGYCGTMLFLRSYGASFPECERRSMRGGRVAFLKNVFFPLQTKHTAAACKKYAAEWKRSVNICRQAILFLPFKKVRTENHRFPVCCQSEIPALQWFLLRAGSQ